MTAPERQSLVKRLRAAHGHVGFNTINSLFDEAADMIEAPTCPSREFLVRQSVLNAIEYWRPFYSLQWLKSWEEKRPLPAKFHQAVIAEFRKIAARYGVSP